MCWRGSEPRWRILTRRVVHLKPLVLRAQPPSQLLELLHLVPARVAIRGDADA